MSTSESKAQTPIRIVIFDGDNKIFEETMVRTPITFGRGTKADIPLVNYEFVSRIHGKFEEQNGVWTVTDQKSSNGIYLNGTRVESVTIQKLETFTVGRLAFRVEPLSQTHPAVDQEITAPTLTDSIQPRPVPPPAAPDAPGGHTELSATLKVPSNSPAFSGAVHVNQKGIGGGSVAVQKVSVQNGHLETRGTLSTHSHLNKSGGGRHRVPVLGTDFSMDLIGPHPTVAQSRGKKLEAVVTWHDQVYEVKEFEQSQVVSVGPAGQASLSVPVFPEVLKIARVGHEKAQCYVRHGHQVSVTRGQRDISMGDLISSRTLAQTEFGYSLKMDAQDVTHVDMGSGIKVHFRYIPSSQRLTNAKAISPEDAVKQSMITSAVLHGTFLLIMLLGAPPQVDTPKLSNVAPKYVRMLMKKPEPTPKPTPPPKKEVVKKEPPKKIIQKPEKIVQHKPVKPPKILEKKNKYPIVVEHPVPKAPPPVDVKTLGALSALGPVSDKPVNPNVITNININPNAGGLPQKAINTGGVIGALPSSNGQLIAGGTGARVKTKGMGFGTGTGYGVQGLKGRAGGRAVAGAIVGEPKLAKSTKVEGLTRAQVMAVVQKYLGEVQHCYERNLLMDPNLAGRMEFEWDISATGSVQEVRVKRSTVNSGDSLGECVKGIFAKMQFPRATNGQTTTPSIGFPFGRL